MDPELILRWLHVLGGGDVRLIAGTARIVVIADMVFTATAAIAQPLTGWLLARETGWDLTEDWLLASLALYVLTGACWLPVVRVQITLRDLAAEAVRDGAALPARYHRLYRLWFALGIPAFAAVLAILWLMVARPDF